MASIILADISSDTPPGSVLQAGDSVVFTLTPNLVGGLLVNVLGSPTLALSNNEVANYTGTNASGQLLFNYTVKAGDDTSDLKVLNVGLNGGTLTVLGLPITLDLGLGQDTGIAIDTMAPATPGRPTLTAASDTGSSSTDGITSDATPTFTGTAEAGSTVTLYDGTTKVGTATAGSNGTYSVTASTLGDGGHTLHVTATDAAGNVSPDSGNASVTIDTTAPAKPTAPKLTVASDTGASSTDGITSDATPTFTGRAEAGSTVTLYNGTTVVGTAIVGSNGVYTVTSTSLADGKHTLHLTATDTAGNTSVSSGNVSVTIDTSGPATPATPTLDPASDTGTSSTDGITSDTTPTFTGTAEAGSTVTLYDGTTKVGTATAGSNGTYSVTASTLGDGGHTLHVTATDAAGNVSSNSGNVSITIDTSTPAKPAAPKLTAASDTGASSTDGITSDATPTFTGSAEAGSTITLYDGTTKVGTAKVGTNGTYSVTASNLGDGAHSLHVTDTNAAGTTSASSGNVRVTIDTSAPAQPATPKLTAASDTGASSTDRITKDTTPTLTGSAEAGSTVTLYDGTTKVGTAKVGTNGTYSVTSSTLSDGAHSLHVTATDAAGNMSTSSGNVNVTIDSTPPARPAPPTLTAASDTGVSSTDRITSDNTPTFTGTGEPGSTVTLTVDKGQTVVGTAKVRPDGSYTVTSSALGDGTHYFNVQLTDAAGNVSQRSAALSGVRIVTSGHTPGVPSIALDPASDTGISSTDGLTKDATPTFTGTAEAGSIVTLYDGSTKVGRAQVAADGSYRVSASKLTNGDHALHVTASDKAGNTSASSAEVDVTIDTRRPVRPSAPKLAMGSDTGLSSSDRLTTDNTPTFTGIAEAGSTVVLMMNRSRTVVGTAMAGADGSYSITSSVVPDGKDYFAVQVTDAAGNVSMASAAVVGVRIDTTAPGAPSVALAPASDTGASSSDGITNDATPTFTGLAEAGSTVTLYDGSTVIGKTTALQDGTYKVFASKLADGAHTLHATATDRAGNVGPSSGNVNITVDATPLARPAAPQLAATSDTGVSSTDRITSDNTPTFTGTAEAGATVTLLADKGQTVVGTATVGTDGSYTVTSSALADGTHYFNVQVTDAAGNVSQPSAALGGVRIDTQVPEVAITNGGAAATRASQLITGTGEAGSTVTLTNNGDATGKAVTVGKNGTWKETITLSSGTNNVVATDTDKAGNAGTSQAAAYQYTPTSPTSMSSLHSMVQAMSTMTPASSASMTPAASPQAAEAHPLAAAH